MEEKYIKDPSLLTDLGFESETDESTDFVRSVYFDKVVEVGDYFFHFRIVFELVLSDEPLVQSNENEDYSFEEIRMAVARRSEEYKPKNEDYTAISAASIGELDNLIDLL